MTQQTPTSQGASTEAGPEALPNIADPAILSTVMEAWRSILGRIVGEDDNFFEVGGNSLRAVQVSRALIGHGLNITALEMFQAPTPLKQSSLIMRHMSENIASKDEPM